MEEKFEEISDKLDSLINNNSVETIFDISDEFYKLIDSQDGATAESQAFIFQKAYEGFKSAAFNFFGTSRQTHNHHNNLLQEKLNLYQTSLTKIQS